VEWCKARARAQHSCEELLLVDEEMRRVITYTTHRAEWWLQQSNRRMDIDVALKDGLIAYSHKQAHIKQERAQRWLSDWAPVRARAKGVLAYLDGSASSIPNVALNVELEMDDEFELGED
ncbi:hypothetical protein GYMLUDRAFT_157398, partial [Collybiopsis luxurians FD-317 M1]